jgi:WD40 repeat protein
MTKRLLIISAFLHLMFNLFPVRAEYALFVGQSESSNFYLFSMTTQGKLQLPPPAYVFPAETGFGDPVDLSSTRDGHFIAMNDFNCTRLLVLEIGANLNFNTIQCIKRDSDAVGFTYDGQYLFTSTDCNKFPPADHGTLALYKWNGSIFDFVTTQSVPTTATLWARCASSSKDEIIASNINAYLHALAGVSIYRLNRETNRFDLQQYFDSFITGCEHCALSQDEKSVIYGGRQNYRIGNNPLQNRNVIGMLKKNDAWDITSTIKAWEDNSIISGIMDVAFVPYQPFGVVLSGFYASTGGGLHLYSYTPDGQLMHVSFLGYNEAQKMAVSPDGKYIAVAWNFGSNISIIRLDLKTGALTEVHRITGPAVGCMAFLPQALPLAAADDACALYGSSDMSASRNSASGKASPRQGKQNQRQRMEAFDSGKWRSVTNIPTTSASQ